MHLQDLTPVGVWTEEELRFHINILEMKVVQLASTTFRDQTMGEFPDLDGLQSNGDGILKETGRRCFLRDVWSHAGDSHLVRVVHGLPNSKVHSGEEERSHQPA